MKSSGCLPSVALLSYFETVRGETHEDITLSVIRETISMHIPLRLRANFAHSHMRIAADIFRQPDTSDDPSHPWSCRRVKKISIVWRFRSRLASPGVQMPPYKPWLSLPARLTPLSLPCGRATI